MGHRLTPTAGASQRTLDQLVERLEGTFAVVRADRDRGADHIGEMIAHYLRMQEGFSRWREPPAHAADIDAMIVRLESLRENAAFITVAEDETDTDRCITFNLVPGEEILIGYANRTHQEAASAVTARVAEALGYEVDTL